MQRTLLTLVSIFAFVLLAAPPATAQTILEGQSPGGAFYRIAVPDGWTPASGLVVWNHGFSLAPIGPDVDLGPLADIQLGEGFAVAASSYSQSGWALFQTERDNRELIDAFEAEFGTPDFVILFGASLGGLVTAQGIEQGDLGNVIGAYPICGALGGSRLWDGALDLRLLYDQVCAAVPAATIPGGATGLPFPLPPGFDEFALGSAVNACTGVLQPAETRSLEQTARLQKILEVTGLPENFVLTDMGFATFGLTDLVHDPLKLNGRSAISNENVDYGDALVDANIERVAADPFARLFFSENFTPSGDVGATKIVSIHTDKDGLVLVENERDYADRVPMENLTTAIIVEDIPTHCGFNAAELLAGWEVLRAWLAGSPKPTAADLQGACELLESGGVPGPCRIDPSFAVPPLDGRVRPRNIDLPSGCTDDATTLCLADRRFQVKVQWETPDGASGAGQAIPQTSDTGIFWFFQSTNLELMVKVLDARSFSGHFWVFYGALTNVEFTLTVVDTLTGREKVYFNPQGEQASFADTSAFPEVAP